MAKRAVRKAEAVVDLEESEYKVGAVASYYDEGWRTGTIVSMEVDNDGDLLVELQPIGSKYATTKPRKVKHKSKDLKMA
jgi:hypothetical protein